MRSEMVAWSCLTSEELVKNHGLNLAPEFFLPVEDYV